MSEVEKYIAVKNFQQQWYSMKRNQQQTYVAPRQQQVQQQQIQQQQIQQQQIQQQVRQQQLQQQQLIQQQQIQQQQQVRQQQVQQQQVQAGSSGDASSSSHASAGITATDKVEVICLDSDSEDEGSREASSMSTSPSSHPPTASSLPTATVPTVLRPLSAAPSPAAAIPRSPAMPALHPISAVSHLPVITTANPDSVTCSADTTQPISTSVHSSLQEGHTPSEAAIAQALANVIHFQRSLAKGLQGSSSNGGSVMSSSSLPDTPSTRAADAPVQPSPPPLSSVEQPPSSVSPLTALIQSIKQYSEPRPQTNRLTQSSSQASRTQSDHSQSPQNR